MRWRGAVLALWRVLGWPSAALGLLPACAWPHRPWWAACGVAAAAFAVIELYFLVVDPFYYTNRFVRGWTYTVSALRGLEKAWVVWRRADLCRLARCVVAYKRRCPLPALAWAGVAAATLAFVPLAVVKVLMDESWDPDDAPEQQQQQSEQQQPLQGEDKAGLVDEQQQQQQSGDDPLSYTLIDMADNASFLLHTTLTLGLAAVLGALAADLRHDFNRLLVETLGAEGAREKRRDQWALRDDGTASRSSGLLLGFGCRGHPASDRAAAVSAEGPAFAHDMSNRKTGTHAARRLALARRRYCYGPGGWLAPAGSLWDEREDRGYYSPYYANRVEEAKRKNEAAETWRELRVRQQHLHDMQVSVHLRSTRKQS